MMAKSNLSPQCNIGYMRQESFLAYTYPGAGSTGQRTVVTVHVFNSNTASLILETNVRRSSSEHIDGTWWYIERVYVMAFPAECNPSDVAAVLFLR